jgi:hypothetical protein
LIAAWPNGNRLAVRQISTQRFILAGARRHLIIKAGWLTNLNSLGYTAFSADYSSGRDARLADDESESIGLFVQQKLDSVGLDLYGGFRRYEVERPDIDLRPMNVFVLGTIFTF